jgi:chromatin segregation and condensation protein Rec8/ScpA/Scc1 (kleisin family)
MENSEIKKAITEAKKKLAGELEEHLKYKEAIDIWEELGKHGEAKRVRKKIRDDGQIKVDQTVVHGDYVDDRDTTYIDDRDTIVKDSVINRSNIGTGGDDKFAKLKELKEMLAEDLIDKDEFKEMKKEIMGK